jgi:hypothetical protein
MDKFEAEQLLKTHGWRLNHKIKFVRYWCEISTGDVLKEVDAIYRTKKKINTNMRNLSVILNNNKSIFGNSK